MRTVSLSSDKTKILIPFGTDNRKELRAFLLAIPGRVYEPETGLWSLPYSEENLNVLVEEGFTLSGPLKVEYEASVENTWERVDVNLPSFLYDYQVESIKYALHHQGRAGWVLRMGRGKTLTALTMAQCLPGNIPALIITPSPVKINFLNDNLKFFKDSGYEVEILSGMDSVRRYYEKKIYVINYELLSLHVESMDITSTVGGKTHTHTVKRLTPQAEDFLRTGFKFLVIDECQRLKNDESKAFAFFSELAKTVPSIVCMSGTPILNTPAELYSWFNVLKPGLWKKYEFLNKYCGPKQISVPAAGNKRRRITTYKGVTNLIELNTRLRSNGLLVFDDKELVKTMPDKPNMFMTSLEVDDLSKYHEVYHDIRRKISAHPGYAMTLLGSLKKTIAELKVPKVIELLELMLESEDKIVVYAHHQQIVADIASHFGKKAVIFNGAITGKQKEDAKNRFINDKSVNLIVGNIQSLGTGVDGLQKSGACNIVFVEFPWTPAEISQAVGRLWRTGFSGEKGINVYFTLVKDTVEEKVVRRLDAKKVIIDATIDGVVSDGDSLLQNMIEVIVADE